MSQYKFEYDTKLIICGFDSRLNYSFMSVHSENGDTLYSNLMEPKPFEIVDFTHFIKIAKELNIVIPDDIVTKISSESGYELPTYLKEIKWVKLEDCKKSIFVILDKYNMTIEGFSDRKNQSSIIDIDGFNLDFYRPFTIIEATTEISKKEINSRWSKLEDCLSEIQDILRTSKCKIIDIDGYELLIQDEIGYNKTFSN